MAATSPYSQNDYQALSNFRPYQLPINEIFKATVAMNQFWDMGAARVKSAYDGILGLQLTNEENRSIRDQFLKDAEKEITKLSAMDLSDPGVQRQGLNIFKPLLQDKGIVSDDAATRHIQRVNSEALNYRNKDGGKAYSQYNHQYALIGAKEFQNSKDRMAGEQFLKQAKEYEPYYDYTEDFQKALKDCHPTETTTQSPFYNNKEQTGYMMSEHSKILSAAQVKGCLEAGMTAKGMRQMQIEGVVNYANNKSVLADDTASYLNSVNSNYSDQLQKLSAQRTNIRDDKNLSQAEKDSMLAALDGQTKSISDEMIKNNVIVGKLSKGDYSPIDENLEGYAGSVYSYRKLIRKATASQQMEVEKKYIADPVQLQSLRFQQEVRLKELDNRYDISLENLQHTHRMEEDMNKEYYKAMFDTSSGGAGGVGKNPFKNGNPFIYDAQSGSFIMNPNLEWEHLNLTDKPAPDTRAFDRLQADLNELNLSDQNNNLRLFNSLINRAEKEEEFKKELMNAFNVDSWEDFKTRADGNKIKGGGIQNTNWFKNYFSGHKEDPLLNRWAEENSNIQLGLQTLNKRMEVGEARVQKELGLTGKPDEILLNSVKGIKVSGSPVSSQEMLDALSGRPGRLVIKKDPYNLQSPFGATYILDGKEIPRSQLQGSPLMDMLVKVSNTVAKQNDRIKEKRAQVYAEEGFNRDRWAMLKDDESDTAQLIQSAFPIVTSSGERKPDKSIIIKGADFSGGIKIMHPGAKKDGSNDILATYKNLLGLGMDVEIPQDGVVVIRGTNYQVLPKAIDSPIMKKAAYNLGNAAVTTEFMGAQEGQHIKGQDISMPVYISGKRQKINIETYKMDGQPEFRVYIEGDDNEGNHKIIDPNISATDPYDLMEKLARMRVDFKKPVQ